MELCAIFDSSRINGGVAIESYITDKVIGRSERMCKK